MTYQERYMSATDRERHQDPDYFYRDAEYYYQDPDYQGAGYQRANRQEGSPSGRNYPATDHQVSREWNRAYRDSTYENPHYPYARNQNAVYYSGRYSNGGGSQQGGWQDLVVGLLGGVAGVIAMDLFSQQIVPMLTQDDGEQGRGQSHDQQGRQHEQPLDSISVIGQHHRQNESSTAALGRILYHWATDEDPDKKTKSSLSYLVHWGYGIAQGGVYASMRGPVEGADLPGGMAFGTALWLLGDELAVPMLGLQDGPTADGVGTHVNRLAMHLVYGVTTAATVQMLRRLV